MTSNVSRLEMTSSPTFLRLAFGGSSVGDCLSTSEEHSGSKYVSFVESKGDRDLPSA